MGTSKTKNVIIATKLAPYPWRLTADSFVNAAKASIARLQRDKIDIAQLHWSVANYAPWQVEEFANVEGIRLLRDLIN